MKDPVEFAIALVGMAGEDDWNALRPALVYGFESYDNEVLRRAFNFGGSVSREPWPHFQDRDDWQVEDHETFTIVRVVEAPYLALVLQPRPDGTWRLDPGPQALALADMFQRGETSWSFPPYPMKRDSNKDVFATQRAVSDNVMSVRVDGAKVQVSVEVMIGPALEGRLPLSGLQWAAGGAEGVAEVIWTTAKIEGDALVFPSVEVEGGKVPYLVALGFEAPESETVEVSFRGLTVNDVEVSFTYVLPRQDLPLPGRDLP